jgi:hypothetical protein
LVGLGRCGHCGAGLEVRSRDHGQRRVFFYSCSSYYRRGKAICPNKIEIPMRAADAAVIETLLDEILTPDRLARVAERAVELAKAEQDAPDLRGGIERQVAECQTALDRLTAAVAAGGDVPALVDALKVQDGRRRDLERRLEILDAPAVRFDAKLEQRLRDAVEEWREVLGRQVPQARQIVQKLLAEKLTFAPEDRHGRRGFRFNATGTVEKLVAGAVPGSLQGVVSPRGTDSNHKPPAFTDLEKFLRRVDTFRRAEIAA